MKIFNKKIWNKAATFLLMAVLLCWNAVQVEAYTPSDSQIGYPIVFENFTLRLDNDIDGVLGRWTFNNQNDYIYTWNIPDEITDVKHMYLGNEYYEFIFPYSPSQYDYYVIGTVVGSSEFDSSFTFKPDHIMSIGIDSEANFSYFWCSDVSVIDYSNLDSNGFAFSAKLEHGDEVANFVHLQFIDDSGDAIIGGDVKFTASVVPVAKGSSEDDINTAILQVLNNINQNLLTNNSLQQQTIDAINQHDANEKSWFQQLIQSMGIGFSTLYAQMTKEQDDKLYGYQDTTTSEAASAFSSESDKLTVLEGELSTQSNTYVTDYASEGFDLGVLATIGSSLIFVTTWFTNFWNMGGVFTACLNFCFALSIVFFILRIKR